MRTAKFIILIVFLVVLVASVIMVFSAKYFSWNKDGSFNYDKEKRIKLIALFCILGSVASMLLIGLL